MKKLTWLLAAILLTANLYSQAPQAMSYQAVIRNSSNALVTNSKINMQISILQGSSTGSAVYVETQSPTTNANGLVSIQVGKGTGSTSAFSEIDWSKGPYFIETETDITGGTNYTITGTTQLLSVPYALYSLYSKTAEQMKGGCGLSIGDTYNGGIIFYLDASNCHGLVCAPNDQSTSIKWNGDRYTYISSQPFADGIGAGRNNTYTIIYNQDGPPFNYAAVICQQLILGNVGDWYLPSKYELHLMYENLEVKGIGNFASAPYWSSTAGGLYAFYVDFSNEFDNLTNRSNTYHVRAVRSF